MRYHLFKVNRGLFFPFCFTPQVFPPKALRKNIPSNKKAYFPTFSPKKSFQQSADAASQLSQSDLYSKPPPAVEIFKTAINLASLTLFPLLFRAASRFFPKKPTFISSTTSFLTATIRTYAWRAGITAAAGTRLALFLLLAHLFTRFSFKLSRKFFIPTHLYVSSLPPVLPIR